MTLNLFLWINNITDRIENEKITKWKWYTHFLTLLLLFLELQPAEKQLAATTTELASNNPMRLLPIVAVLIAIVLLLVILAVIFVIIIRGRNNCTNSNSAAGAGLMASSDTTASMASATTPGYMSQKPASRYSDLNLNISLQKMIDNYKFSKA